MQGPGQRWGAQSGQDMGERVRHSAAMLRIVRVADIIVGHSTQALLSFCLASESSVQRLHSYGPSFGLGGVGKLFGFNLQYSFF